MADIIDNPPNTAPPVEKVWMFVSRDAEGHEHVCGAEIGFMGMQPLITGNEHMLEKVYKPLAVRTLPFMESTGKTLHLLEFSNRKEVTDWQNR